MKTLRPFQIDAFTGDLFRGNPAGVCPLEGWLPDETLQAIAAENHLPETAFFVRKGELFCSNRGERALIAGEAVTYLDGHIRIPE